MLALLAAAAFGVYLYRKLTEKNIITFGKQPWKDIRSPYQRAYDRSMVLENSSLLKMDKVKEYYTGLVAVLRLYLQEEYGIDAELFTTKDLAKQMKQYGINVANISKTRAFLSHADMVKFAKMKPKSAGADLMKLYDILQSLDMEHTPADLGAAGEPGAYIPPSVQADSYSSGDYGYGNPYEANVSAPPPPPVRKDGNDGVQKPPYPPGGKGNADDSRWQPPAGRGDDRYMPPAPGQGEEK